MMGIYLITNISNGSQYVGMSNNIKRRFIEHKTSTQKKTTTLGKAFKKYSIDNFKFEILEEITSIDMLPIREKYWIEKIKPRYNMNEGGEGNCGLIVKEEVRELLRTMGKLQWEKMPLERRNSIIKNNLKGPSKGHIVTEATREKLRKAALGVKKSKATLERLSKSQKIAMLGNKNGNKAVSMFTLENVYVRDFDSIIEAAKFIGRHPSNITKVLKGEQAQSGNHKWKYK